MRDTRKLSLLPWGRYTALRRMESHGAVLFLELFDTSRTRGPIRVAFQVYAVVRTQFDESAHRSITFLAWELEIKRFRKLSHGHTLYTVHLKRSGHDIPPSKELG